MTEDRDKRVRNTLPKSLQNDQRITTDIEALKITADDLESQFKQVKVAQSTLDQTRKDRNAFAKSGNAIQTFAANIKDFLNVYSSIAGISDAADSQYGSLVTHALSVLVIVAVNKEAREVAISNALEDLTPWLSRLQKYKEAYPKSGQMAQLVGDVYKKIKEFAEESCRYFNRRPIRRFWEGIRRPPKLYVDVKVSEIKDAIFQVVSEGLAQFVSHYEANARQNIQDKWIIIQKLVGLPIEQIQADLISTACETLYTDVFKYPGKRRGRALQCADLELLKNEPSFTQWTNEFGSSTLLLTGNNYDQFGKGVGLCWLSTAALAIKQNVETEGLVLFHSACRSENSKRIQSRESFSNILNSFVCQILQWDETFFEKVCTRVEQELKDPTWTSPSPAKRHRIQGDLLISLLNSWTGSKTIYMIIDRLDKFDGEPDDNPYDLIREILRIISKTACTIKLVIIADSLVWGDDNKEIMAQWKDLRGDPELTWARISSIYTRVRWHQPQIGRI